MQRPRQPASAPPIDATAPVTLDSPSGFWPLGFFERAKILSHSIGLHAHKKARDQGFVNATHAQRLAIQQSLQAISDPIDLLTGIFANAPIACVVLRADGHVLACNPAAQALLGGDLKPGFDFLADRVNIEHGVVDAVKRAFAGEAVTLPAFWHDVEKRRDAADARNRIAVSVSAFPVLNARRAIEHVAITYRDDTDVMQAHLRLQAQSEQLEQHILSRTGELEAANEELEAFSYSVSHDLRAPLRAIDSFAALLAEDKSSHLSGDSQGYVGRIRTAAARMSDLINDLLAFSRLGKQPLTLQDVTPAKLVRQVLEELEPKMRGRDIAIELGDLPGCRADPSLLREVFLNLLDNAIKFTGKRAHASIEIGARKQDDQLVWYVSDNGVGFDMAHYDRLFGVFSRLHSVDEFEGTGVGLALVQRIVKRHGGAIWAKSELGKGAVFYFTLGK